MKIENGYPWVGRSARGLGVRVGNVNGNQDIPINADGSVDPKTGGMSVASSWRQLPSHRIPERLKDNGAPHARSKYNDDKCWAMSSGDFSSGPVNGDLALEVDISTHGTVQPAFRTSRESYEQALSATKLEWVIDEA